MERFELIKNGNNDPGWFQKYYPRHKVTSDTVRHYYYQDGYNIYSDSIVVTGDTTPHGCFRKMKDGYIYAGYSMYTRFDNDLRVIENDCEDR